MKHREKSIFDVVEEFYEIEKGIRQDLKLKASKFIEISTQEFSISEEEVMLFLWIFSTKNLLNNCSNPEQLEKSFQAMMKRYKEME